MAMRWIENDQERGYNHPVCGLETLDLHLELQSRGHFPVTAGALSCLFQAHWLQMRMSVWWFNLLYCHRLTTLKGGFSNKIMLTLIPLLLPSVLYRVPTCCLSCKITRSVSNRERMGHHWKTTLASSTTNSNHPCIVRTSAPGMEFHTTNGHPTSVRQNACTFTCLHETPWWQQRL